jgi:hypothetical protein
MIKVSVESPYAQNPALMTEYAKLCCKDALQRGETPMASHLFFTQFLDDKNPEERKLGLAASDHWRFVCDKLVFYVDHGWSSGMQHALDLAKTHDITVEFRTLTGNMPMQLLRALGMPV